MKKLLFLIILTGIFNQAISQTGRKPDSEKLLEYYQMQRYAEAAAYLQSIYPEDTEDVKALSQIAYTNLMANKLPEAENTYLKIYALDSTSLPVLFNLANINARRRNDEQAKKYYLQILKIDSTNFNVYKQLGFLSQSDKSKEMIQKLRYFKKANELNPTDSEVVFELCEIYAKMKFYNPAEKILDPALAADTANLQLLKMKMVVSMGMKKYDEAVATGEKLFSYGDSSTFVLNNLGKSYFLLEDYKNALNYFLIVKDQSTDNEGLFYNIALSYRGLKDYKNAVSYFEKAIKEGISPKIASYYGLMGDSYEHLDLNKDANVAYKQGLLFENTGSLLYNIALVYETKLNDKKNAINYYNQYLKTINAKEQPKLISFINNKIADLTRRMKND